MQVAIACDHAGFALKEPIIEAVLEAGHTVTDLGTFNTQKVDYPDYAEKAGLAIQNKEVERAIIICGSGVGACMAANKMKGVYACLCHDTYSAHQGVEHDNMNVLCLGGRIIGVELAKELVKAFLSARFLSDEPRHVQRVNKLKAIESRE